MSANTSGDESREDDVDVNGLEATAMTGQGALQATARTHEDVSSLKTKKDDSFGVPSLKDQTVIGPDFKDQVRTNTPAVAYAKEDNDDREFALELKDQVLMDPAGSKESGAGYGPTFKDQVRNTAPGKLLRPPSIPAARAAYAGAESHLPLAAVEEPRTSDPAAPAANADTESQLPPLADAELRPITIEIPAAYLVEDEPEQVAPVTSKKKTIGLGVLLMLIVVMAVVGGVCGSGKCGPETQQREDTESTPDENLMASLRFISHATEDPFQTYAFAETRLENDFANVTTGTIGSVTCDPEPCTRGPLNCGVNGKVYEPGCCLGANCTERADWCGEYCPSPLTDCQLKDPTDTTCFKADCYICDKVEGEDLWVITDFIQKIDCLATGTATSSENGQLYKWAIACGPIVAGGKAEDNYGIGEYACRAYRQGAGYSEVNGGIVTGSLPCQFIQHGECGCAPDDVAIFAGLPPPNGPCVSENDCHFLCEDAGLEKVQTLCDAFGIEWWNGENFLNSSLWVFQNGEAEIYIKGIDV